jgi:hypothetical protein
MHISERADLTSSLGNSISLKNSELTYKRASSGHLLNQSRVQQLTRDGNIRHLTLRVSPTGDMHRQM